MGYFLVLCIWFQFIQRIEQKNTRLLYCFRSQVFTWNTSYSARNQPILIYPNGSAEQLFSNIYSMYLGCITLHDAGFLLTCKFSKDLSPVHFENFMKRFYFLGIFFEFIEIILSLFLHKYLVKIILKTIRKLALLETWTGLL